MKYIFIIISIILLFTSSAYSQKIVDIYKPELIKDGTGFSSQDQSFGICEDASGNLYHTGYFEGEISFGETTLISKGGKDIFVAKINKDGYWEWARSAGGNLADYGKDITCDNNGNIYITGYFFGTCDFGNISLNSSGNTEVFIAKLSNTGDWLWAKSGVGTGFNRGNSIICDNSNNVYVTGSFESNITFGTTTLTSSGYRDIFVAKLNSSGNWVWAIKAGGSLTEESVGIRYNANNSFIAITGFYSGNSVFGNTTLNANGARDIFIAKIDFNGNWLWAKSAGSNGNDESRGIAIDKNGNSVITGYYTNAISFGSINLPAGNSRDIFIAKIDKNGDWLWAKSASGNSDDEANAIAIDNSGFIYVTGTFNEDIKFGNIELNSLLDRNLFIVKLNQSGNWSWAKMINGTSQVDGLGITVTSNGVATISGSFYKDAISNIDTLYSKGDLDILLAQISTTGEWSWHLSNGGIIGIISVQQAAVDSLGNIIIAGYFNGTVKFANDTLKSKSSNDIFIAVLSKENNWLKAVSFGGLGDDRCNSIAVDTFGNIYLTGYFDDTIKISNTIYAPNGLADIFIMKLNQNLYPEWVKVAGTEENDLGQKIAFKNEEIVVTGVYSKKIFFGTKQLNTKGNEDIFVTKLDLDGNFLWASSCGSTQFDYIKNLKFDNNNNIIITGAFEGTCYFGTNSVASKGGEDIFVAKMNSDGDWLWARSAGTANPQESGIGIDVDEQNNIYLAGNFKGLCLFDDQYCLSNGGSDIFLSKIDSDGNWKWTKSFGGLGNDFVSDLAIINNTIQILGNVASTFTYDGKKFNGNNVNGNAFISAFNKNGNILWVLSDESNGYSEFNSIAIDEDMNAVISAKYISNFKIGSKTLTNDNSVDLNSFCAIAGFTLDKPNWVFRDSTGTSSIVKIPKSINPKVNNRNLAKGDAVGVLYTRNSNLYCAGMSYWTGNDLEITVWGDDVSTPMKDGFYNSEKYSIVVWDVLKAEEVLSEVRYSEGPNSFTNGAYSVISQLPIIYDTLRINLANGWNMISSYNLPKYALMDSIFKPIKSKINLVKSITGSSYIPQFNINGIGNWDITQAYQVFANSNTILEIIGDFIKPEETTISLSSGWNMLPYFRNSEQSIVTALSSIVSQNKVNLVKNILGQSYIPQFNINGIGNMLPCQGYFILMSSEAQFKYQAND